MGWWFIWFCNAKIRKKIEYNNGNMIFNYWLQQNNNAIVAKSINRKKHQHSKTLVVLPMTFVFLFFLRFAIKSFTE